MAILSLSLHESSPSAPPSQWASLTLRLTAMKFANRVARPALLTAGTAVGSCLQTMMLPQLHKLGVKVAEQRHGARHPFRECEGCVWCLIRQDMRCEKFLKPSVGPCPQATLL